MSSDTIKQMEKANELGDKFMRDDASIGVFAFENGVVAQSKMKRQIGARVSKNFIMAREKEFKTLNQM